MSTNNNNNNNNSELNVNFDLVSPILQLDANSKKGIYLSGLSGAQNTFKHQEFNIKSIISVGNFNTI